jgi:DNA (cytosine-5)-methyltransferase 1
MKRPSLQEPCNLNWLKSQKRPARTRDVTSNLRVAELFAGCGGFALGVIEGCRSAKVSVDIVLAVDSDPRALAVYQKNLGVFCKRAECTSVEELFGGKLEAPSASKEKELANSLGPVDLLIAGPPCQGHSDLNNHSRRYDRRNALYARVARAVEVLQPKVVMIENVPGVVNDRGRSVSRVRNLLEQRGYTVKSLNVDAAKMGVPQRRRRHFLFAFSKSLESRWFPVARSKDTAATLGDVLSGLEDEPCFSTTVFKTPSAPTTRNLKRIAYLYKTNTYDLPDSNRPPCHKDKKHSYKAVYGRLHWDGVANTITSGFGSMGQGRYVHPTRPRLITPHEAARIQGFPDWFSFADVTSRVALQEMIGNAVIPKVAASLVQHLLATKVLEPQSLNSQSLQGALVA